MSIRPIDIQIEDDWKFGEVAYLVDRDDFIENLIKARKKLGIKNLIPHTPEDINKWREEELNQTINKNLSKTKSKKEFSFPVTRIQIIKHNLLDKYHLPLFYADILEAAILCGLITDEDFSVTAYIQIIDPQDYIERYKKKKFLGYPKIAIILSPETKLEEIEVLYKNSLPEEMHFYQQNYLKTNQDLTNPAHNKKRDRKWYWERRKGKWPIDIALQTLDIDKKSYKLALKEHYKNRELLDKITYLTNTIKQALKRYKKALKSRYS